MIKKFVANSMFIMAFVLNIAQLLYYYPDFHKGGISQFLLSDRTDSYSNASTMILCYLALISFVLILFPLMARSISRSPGAMINLQNKDYWLAPVRIQATTAHIYSHVLWFGTLTLILFLDFFHQTIISNIEKTERLSHPLTSIVVYFVILTLMYMHFNYKFKKTVK